MINKSQPEKLCFSSFSFQLTGRLGQLEEFHMDYLELMTHFKHFSEAFVQQISVHQSQTSQQAVCSSADPICFSQICVVLIVVSSSQRSIRGRVETVVDDLLFDSDWRQIFTMRFEEILDDVGGFSKFQFLLLFILCLPRAILPLHFLLHNFVSATPSHHCALGSQEDGGEGLLSSDPEALALRIPRQDDGSFSSCRVYDPPLTSNLSHRNTTAPCPHGWIYDQSQFSSTTATEWDLVCDDKKLNQALATYFFLGVTFGAILFGQLSDK
eukprot:superscaffoldBa00001146_g9176